MKKPRRIQLSRKKSWRMPPNTVKVARPSKWGNPWYIGQVLHTLSGPEQGREVIVDRQKAVELYRDLANVPSVKEQIRDELRGRNLACFCKIGDLCHADVLLEVANAPTEKRSHKRDAA